MPKPLSPVQCEVLAIVAAGKVTGLVFAPYTWYAEGRREPVSATVKILLRERLIEVGPDRGARWRPAALTDAGRALLDTLTATSEGGSA